MAHQIKPFRSGQYSKEEEAINGRQAL